MELLEPPHLTPQFRRTFPVNGHPLSALANMNSVECGILRTRSSRRADKVVKDGAPDALRLSYARPRERGGTCTCSLLIG